MPSAVTSYLHQLQTENGEPRMPPQLPMAAPRTNGEAIGTATALVAMLVHGWRSKRQEVNPGRLERWNRAAAKYQPLWLAVAALAAVAGIVVPVAVAAFT